MAISKAQKAGLGLGGGLSGAATGATIGSIVPGIGTAIGAGIGGLGGLLGGLLAAPKTTNQIAKEQKAAALKKSLTPGASGVQVGPQGLPEGVGTYNLYTPAQQQAFNTVLGQALSGLGQNKFDFAPIEAQARKGFSEQTIPSIAERFTRLGAQRSNAFAQQLGAAGAGLESDLAALKSNYNLQQQQALQNLLGIGLRPQYEAYFRPGDDTGSFGRNLAAQLLNKDTFSGIGQIADWARQRRSSVVPPLGGNVAPVSSLEALNAISNPSNIVAGSTIPGNIVQGVGTPSTMTSMPTTGIGALKALYGI